MSTVSWYKICEVLVLQISCNHVVPRSSMWQLDVEPEVHGVPWLATTFSSSSRGKLARAGWDGEESSKETCRLVRQILWHERYLTGVVGVRTKICKNSASRKSVASSMPTESLAPIQPNADYDADDDDANNLSELHNLSFLNGFLYHW